MAFKKKDKQTEEETTQEETVDRSPRAARSSNRKKFDRNSFRRPNDLSIPAELDKYMRAEGYYLYWVSVVDAKTKQFTNAKINYYLSVGGDLVTAKEIKEVDASFLSGLTKYAYQEEWADEGDDRYSMDGIRKEHLVLMKLPLEFGEYKQEQNRKLVKDQLETAQMEYKKNDNAFVEDFKHGSSQLKLKEGFFKD